MALIFMDGFDHYNPITYPTIKWDSGQNSVSSSQLQTGGRLGTGCVLGISSTTSVMKKTLPAYYNSLVVGFAVSQAGTSNIMSFFNLYQDNTSYITLSRTPTSLFVSSGDTTLGTYTDTFSSNMQYYLELKTIIHDTNGLVQLRINDYLALDLTNIDTKVGSGSAINQLGFICGTDMTIKLDDLYVCDLAGTINNNFLGECRIDAIRPISNGDNTAQTPSMGSNYQCVDDTNFDNGADYVSTAVLNYVDSYIYGGIPVDATGVLYGLQLNMVAKRTDAGVPTKIKPIVRIDSTNYLQAELSLDVNYKSSNTIVELNPFTDSTWNKTDISNTQFGVILSYNPTSP